ncbi:MAG: DUF1846 domain-containing protein [SAR324 cluster bacterium]|uniref:DUF1846 domain-containing protein n=1 Tax=SAR324 cluster bacterium TaxID=2024889 RepID=A0A7X9FRF5_9DELT|nr:DUF1846 domain-containing protein [SAR324 cluster bacterium]
MIGFDNEKYLQAQTTAIRKRVEQFSGKLYLEFGGKILQDLHAARVLPGYDPDVKIKLLDRLRDLSEILFCVNAADIEKGRIRGDFGITYDQASLRTFDDLEDFGFSVSAVLVTRYHGEKNALRFMEIIKSRGIPVYTHTDIPGYPYDVTTIVSPQGFGKNAFIETSKALVIVTGAGPGSGKMSTCLSQIYHHNIRGQKAGYAKFETFPIWNLPLDHPANVAYEAATADLKDLNMIDPFHLEAYGVTSINYNRDIENFHIIKEIINRIGNSTSPFLSYRSPTDMGVNTAKEGIVDDDIVREAAKQEIIRRYFRYSWECKQRLESPDTVAIVENLMRKVGVKEEDRPVVPLARKTAEEAKEKEKGNRGIYCGAAIELANGEIVTGMNTPLMHAESSAVLNALKVLAGIPKPIDLLSDIIIKSLVTLKQDILLGKSPSLNVEETLIALAISAASNSTSAHCMKMLKLLKGCEMHTTHEIGRGDENGLRKLRMNVTTDAHPTSRGFYY